MTETSTGRKSDTLEPSMEDILASIRRILAEDGGAASRAAGAGHAAAGDTDVTAAFSPEAGTEPGRPTEGLVMDGADNPSIADGGPEPPIRPPAGPTGAAAGEDVFLLSPEMRAGDHTLVSQQAAENSTDVLSQLARAILDRRDIAVATRDVTLESMVREMLRPLLREWLDRNLPYLIERLVKKEINLMINRAERLED
jgi:cell pole-organizing protein PopZ